MEFAYRLGLPAILRALASANRIIRRGSPFNFLFNSRSWTLARLLEDAPERLRSFFIVGRFPAASPGFITSRTISSIRFPSARALRRNSLSNSVGMFSRVNVIIFLSYHPTPPRLHGIVHFLRRFRHHHNTLRIGRAIILAHPAARAAFGFDVDVVAAKLDGICA